MSGRNSQFPLVSDLTVVCISCSDWIVISTSVSGNALPLKSGCWSLNVSLLSGVRMTGPVAWTLTVSSSFVGKGTADALAIGAGESGKLLNEKS